ncbi:MAG: 5-bromo-4-chloroindolyl phosphate hydrolysis family protein [Oscillospiraceae bacterium]|nr:5-bromo-4-chloroindolyl phosphate hydrolysis family protein [Oscillospiraceae bacterium]
MPNVGGELVIKKKGGAEMVLGAVLVLFPLILLPYRPAGVGGLPAMDYFVRLVLMVAFLWGLRMLISGIRKRSLYQKLLRMQGLFDNTNRVSIKKPSELLGCSLTRLVGDVRAMQKFKMVKGLYADLWRGDLVYTGDKPPIDIPAEDGATPALREEHKKSASPIYAFGFVWAAYAFFFPFYRPLDLALAFVVAAVAFFQVSWSSPARAVILEVVAPIPEPVQTGNQALDDMLIAVSGHMQTLHRLERSISAPVDERVRDLIRTTEQIVEQVKKHPQKARDIRQFMGYTLPTTINLLQSYEELCAQPVEGKNITASKKKIEGMMCTIADAFHRQLDALFADKALNIEVELEVMSQMLKNNDGINVGG